MIVILDYGMGNLRSVEKAIQFLGYDCRVQEDLSGASKVIIPGVGAFGAAMERLDPMGGELRKWAADGQPLMGICLGQQLLLETSEELGEHRGLGIVPGRVKYLPSTLGLKVPHIGWSALDFAENPLTQGLTRGDQVYFVHSLYCECDNPADVASTTTYGIPFASAIRHGNVWGAQFHPEKSGAVGLQILKNFLAC